MNFYVDFDFHQKVSSVVAILFVFLLSTLFGILTVNKSDQVISGFSETVVTHEELLKQR